MEKKVYCFEVWEDAEDNEKERKEFESLLKDGWEITDKTEVLNEGRNATYTDRIIFVLTRDDKKEVEVCEETFDNFDVGEAVIYQNGNKFELGIVKTVCGNNEYFVYYHTGDTAAKTHARNLHKINNNYAFHVIRLDPDDKERR